MSKFAVLLLSFLRSTPTLTSAQSRPCWDVISVSAERHTHCSDRCSNTSACQGLLTPCQAPCCGWSKQGQCQWWAVREAAPESPKPCSAAPVMERKVHVPFLKSSFLLSRSRMRHSNQPSSSRVSRSIRREAPRVRDTRPVGGGGKEEGVRERKRERVSAHTHTQPDWQSQHMQEEGLPCRGDRHPVSQKATVKVFILTANRSSNVARK